MPVTLATVRLIALALPGVEEGLYFETAAFYVRRKMVLRLREDGETLVVAFPKGERADLIASQPDIYSVTAHYLNYDYVLLSLLAVDEASLRRMIEQAWRLKASKRQIALYENCTSD